MKTRFGVGLVLTVFLSVGPNPELRAASPAEDLFQQALMKESGERNLEAAIELYRLAIAQADADPQRLAEARLRLAGCHERLGQNPQAETVYRELLADPSTLSSEMIREARSGLRRIDALRRAEEDAAARSNGGPAAPATAPAPAPAKAVTFHPTRASLSLGPGLGMAAGETTTALSVAFRYRLSAEKRPLAISVETAALVPLANSVVHEETRLADTRTTDSGTLRMRYQVAAWIVAELPHGVQRTLIPEMGVGFAVTGADLRVETAYRGTQYPAASQARVSRNTISPSLCAGLQVFPDRAVSLLLQGTFTQTPFPQSIQLAAPPHSQTFTMPSSLWTAAAKIQVKIGWFRRASGDAS